jgi:peptidoglycan hydrolase-like protein with peptidoglycan-binding domain/predicted nucleotidyltransferase
MSNLKNILNSFHLKDELNPKIWVLPNERYMSDPKGQVETMRPKVRARLLEIANEFIEVLKVDIVVSDIIMTGSLANYNWSSFSDIDLHILVDFNQFSESQLPLYTELFGLKKTLYNDTHNITIYGYEVELYVQNESETHFSSGVYSVLYDEWINNPKKEDVTIDTNLIKNKATKWMEIIDGAIENAQDEPLEEAKRLIQKYKDKIKKYRTCGLEKDGEYSDENLVFKVLRRNGYIQKLFDFENEYADKKLSIKESTTNIGGTFKTDLENGPKNHGGRALGNWQSDNAWDIFSPAGTVVNSYTEGVVTKIRDTGKNSGKVYGTQVSIKGSEEFPDIFYTHLKDVKLQTGDVVKLGDYIGTISEWLDNENMTHVHIGLPIGNTLSELLVNSDKIFTGSEENTQSTSTENSGSFLTDLDTISKSGKEFRNLKKFGSKIPYDKDVEKIQTALQFLGYSLPKWGIDGLFGPETESAVKSFESANGISSDGKLSEDDLIKLVELLTSKGFTDSDLSKIQTTSDFDKINVGNDNDFYKSILTGIGAPITDENLKFFYSWRKAEGGKATNNPFNTTLKLNKDSEKTDYNDAGVKNYSTPNYGIEATVKTLLLPYYTCIVDGLKNDIGSSKISECESLKTWGTGDLVAKVLSRGDVTPPKIYA